MTENAEKRLADAREHQWLGEVGALEEGLIHLRRSCNEVEQLHNTLVLVIEFLRLRIAELKQAGRPKDDPLR